MSYKVPDSPNTLPNTNSNRSSYHSLPESDNKEIMSNPTQINELEMRSPPNQIPSSSGSLTLLPPHLWSLPYITFTPEILQLATQTDPNRVSELFAASAPVATPPVNSVPPQPSSRIPVPTITPYDGKPSSLRAFCSQLVNQIQSEQFDSEIAEVRFAYNCLGPGALSKMRSSFRCLEDPSFPPEINTLEEFLRALKQRCEDPSLRDQATTKVEEMRQHNMKFHDFITLFEDNMADSIYSSIDKSNWKLMLERRLSPQLRSIILSSSDVPEEYHSFVAYLRRKDAGYQEILASNYSSTSRARPPLTFPTPPSKPPFPSSSSNLKVSQGGSAMDLDMLSRERGPDGHLTPQAKSARKALGRCMWCNKLGHMAYNCPLNSRSITSATINEDQLGEQLKE